MKKILVFISLFVFLCIQVYAQERLIRGTVIDVTEDLPLPGVTIMIKGTTTGTTTDVDGNYEIRASSDDTLIFRFVGMETKEIEVGDQDVIDVGLMPTAATLEQVVITALGIQREERQLTVNIQRVDSEALETSRQENLVNALQGRVSGVQITSTGGAPGAASEIILRGATSVDGDNQPLFVVDGIPISNASIRGTTNRAADINPNDIESISILKGAAAAALYGIDAANGAIIITTKKGKEGVVSVDFSSSTSLSKVGSLHDVQNTYTTGAAGLYNPNTFSHWGPKHRRSDEVYNNLENFFQTGMSSKIDANVSGGSENLNYYLAVSNLNEEGIVPNTLNERRSALLTGTANITDKLTITTRANMIKSHNRYGIVEAAGGWLSNVYRWPRWDNMENIYNPDGSKRHVWYPSSGNFADVPDNPLWVAHHNVRNDNVDRALASANINYEINDWLRLDYNAGRDYFSQHYKALREWGSSGAANQGTISEFSREVEKFTSTAILTADLNVTNDLMLTALVGNNIQSDYSLNSFIEGERFRNPTLHSINNLQEIRTSQSTSRRRVVGVFGDITLDYKRFLVLGATGRNDWSSTLPLENRSFFYPSFSFAFIPSEIYEGDLSDVFSFAKLRASYAQVGKDAPPHRLTQTLTQFYGINEGWRNDPFAGNPMLKPEITTEFEIGVDMRFWEGLFNVDLTYYQRKSDDQIIQPRVTPVTGAILQTVNSGSVENKGLELLLISNIIRREEMAWKVTLNSFGNRSRLTKLFGDLVEFPVTYGQVSSQAIASSWLGEPLFGIVGTDYARTDDGTMIVDEEGYPIIDTEKRYIGNREPKVYFGLDNNFRYKNFEVSFLIDGTYGAEIMNATSQLLISSGNHAMMEDYRHEEMILDGVVEQEDGSYKPNEKPIILDREFFQNYYIQAGTNFVEEAWWVRLRNVNFMYYLPESLTDRLGMTRASVFINGQNLFLLTNYSGGDPEVNNAGPGGGASGAGTMGVDYFQVPNRKAVTFGFNVNF
ncbi:MAG: SusC/RagA family TonB-linked outer membrane protein [Bacteroidales bacterium]